MPLPSNFTAWEHLQQTINYVYKRLVDEEFRDVQEDNWAGRSTLSRASLPIACAPKDSDTASVLAMGMMLFLFYCRKAQDMPAPIYGIPVTTFQKSWQFTPQVKLYFSEDADDVEEGYSPINAEIGFRLVGQT